MSENKSKYKVDNLYDWTISETYIQCSSCHKSDSTMGGDEEYFFDKGWRATKDNCYCPSCAKKKLKNV